MKREIMGLESIKKNKKLASSFFEEETVSFAAAYVINYLKQGTTARQA